MPETVPVTDGNTPLLDLDPEKLREHRAALLAGVPEEIQETIGVVVSSFECQVSSWVDDPIPVSNLKHDT